MDLHKKEITKKLTGAVYTPSYIVKDILNLSGYTKNILKKHIMDNSCGDGAFLMEVVDRYCRSFLKSSNDKQKLKEDLETYIHGIDNDKIAVSNCISNLSKIVSNYDLEKINWDIHVNDALTVSEYHQGMDFVVGNPPYIRVHNLNDSYKKVKEYTFADSGMTDLFIVFFEIGLRMLNQNGVMGLITPSSFLRSKAGKNLRLYISKNKSLKKVVDLGHFQPFKATTYTLISIFDKSKQFENVEYFIFDDTEKKPSFVESLSYNDIFIDGKIYFSSKKDLNLLHKIEAHSSSRKKRHVVVKNGFATLADKIFIGDFHFRNGTIEILKASTGKWQKCIFPYKSNGSPFTLNEVKTLSEVYNYLLENKDALIKRDLENEGEWFLFGRSQAIKDVFVNKIAINTTIKDVNSVKINFVPSGKGVYSGLYILSPFDMETIKKTLLSNEFIRYLQLLKNYKSGGYYSFSTSELEKYLSYKLEVVSNGQLDLFGST